jgi:serine/threonine-protein kinase
MSSPESSDVPDDGEPSEGDAGPDPLIGTVIADRYRVDEKLGVGGMGAVYRAEHVLMKKPVAVKVLHREMTVVGEVVKRFEREAIAAGRIDHPNITVATDFGKLPDGAFYLVLEYVPGRSLSTAMKEDGPFSVERALFIARQVAAGLGAAHAANIVHRDLKPDNIMLIERGSTKDFVKVLDFGIAKVAEDGAGQLTRIGAVFGTPQYMAPEQAAGKPVDHRADLYSLGLVLYEMLTGKAAFGAMELVAILTKQLTEPPPPLPASVDADVAALVMRLAEKDPDARIQTAAELVAWIDHRLGPGAAPQ